ncbi:MAG: bifunctional oligoribonuclease/PAP phosphatase NrnA [Thermoanaerobacterales bacterium]|nr:bifunctional oligoribonuclease/PAP phosphatase NrnA [Thermoanaerobacterales bacterium]
MINDLPGIAAVVRQARRPVIAGHVMPDGDCIGSVLGLSLILEALDQQPTLVSADPVPLIYRFLPAADRFHVGHVPPGEYDLFIMLDCSVPERLGDPVKLLLSRPGLQVVNIDHHISTQPFGDYNYIDAGASAVGEIVYDLAGLLNVPLTREIAVCLYTAILTDTGCFRYDNTTADTHRRVARLIECGLSPAMVATAIYDEKPLSALRLLSAVLQTLRVSDPRRLGRLAWMRLTQAMERQVEAREEDADGLINYARMVEGVEVALLFRETADGKVKVGFRSKHAVDVSRLAGCFGGGGHPRAAGSVIEGSIDEVEAGIVAAALETLDGGGSEGNGGHP